MKTQVTGRHVKLTDALRKYAEEKASKLARIEDGIHTIQVVLSSEQDRQNKRQIVEMIAYGKRLELIAEVERENMYEAIDLVVNKLQRQLRRRKGKRASRRIRETQSA